MTKKLKPIYKTLLFSTGFVLLICLIIGMSLLFSRGQSLDFTTGGEDNLELLNELNAGWTLSKDYEVNTIDIDGLYGEWLTEKDTNQSKVILQLHGGAYIRSLNYRKNLYQRMAEQYARVSGMSVLTIDYRIAPKDPYPAALMDAVKAYEYLLANGFSGEDIIIAGDSAGGGLALALCLYLRDNGIQLPKAIITMSAWTNLNYRRYKPDYVGTEDAKNPYISPIYGDFTGLPPMLMQVGTKDIINDTTLLAESAREQGVAVVLTTYDGMIHVFQALFPAIDEANQAWSEVEEFIKEQYK